MLSIFTKRWNNSKLFKFLFILLLLSVSSQIILQNIIGQNPENLGNTILGSSDTIQTINQNSNYSITISLNETYNSFRFSTNSDIQLNISIYENEILTFSHTQVNSQFSTWLSGPSYLHLIISNNLDVSSEYLIEIKSFSNDDYNRVIIHSIGGLFFNLTLVLLLVLLMREKFVQNQLRKFKAYLLKRFQ